MTISSHLGVFIKIEKIKSGDFLKNMLQRAIQIFQTMTPVEKMKDVFVNQNVPEKFMFYFFKIHHHLRINCSQSYCLLWKKVLKTIWADLP